MHAPTQEQMFALYASRNVNNFIEIISNSILNQFIYLPADLKRYNFMFPSTWPEC